MSECGVAFPCFYLVFILYQEIDVVESIHQTMLLVAVDVELLRAACSLIGYTLVGQVDLHFCLGIVLNCQKQFLQEIF